VPSGLSVNVPLVGPETELRGDWVAVGIVAVELANQLAVVQHAEAGVVGIRGVVIDIYRDSGRVAGSQAVRPGIGETIGPT
jgi:hypothetical protein